MSMSSALSSALSGLRATQAQLTATSGNIANVNTAGYSRRSVQLEESTGNGEVNGVRVVGVQRALDTILQRELRTETAGSGYTAVRATITDQLQSLFGTPGAAGSLPSVLNDFTTALQALANDPASTINRTTVLGKATTLASTLNAVSSGIQDLRANAETQIGADVDLANQLLKGIAAADAKVGASNGMDPSLLDQRDALVNQLAKLVDVNVMTNANGTISLSTTNGLRLYDPGGVATLSFDGRSVMSPTSLYSNSASRGVGTITATMPGGGTVDAIAQGLIKSGEIAGLLELRDKTLVDAQAQVDELAAGLASAMSNRIDSTAVANGFAVNTTGMAAGNVMTVQAVIGGVPKTFSFVNVATGGTLPANATGDPNDIEVAVDFSNAAGALSTIQTQLAGLTVTGSGSTFTIVNNGANTVRAASASVTVAGTQTGVGEFPLFVDGSSTNFYTGSFANGSQKTGLAARLIVNPSVKADASLLVKMTASTPAGDTTRPSLMLDRLTSTSFTFGLASSGGTAAAFTGTVSELANRVVGAQGEVAASAQRLDEGQKVVQSSIESRYSDATGVNVDTELANLVQLQNAYSANARIMSAIKEMMDLLMRI